MRVKLPFMKYPRFLLALAGLFSACIAQTVTPADKPAVAPAPAVTPPPAPVDASAPLPKTGNAGFFQKHEKFLARAKSGPIGVLFLGDSITEGWAKAPHIWDHYYGQFQPANFGIGGDLTQHVIWRIENGELDGISPKVVVLMLGTNNSAAHTAEQIAAADRKIVQMIRARLPQTRVLLLAIFPRGPRRSGNTPDPWEKRMEVIHAVNVDLAKLDDG